jgi:hypothetical protein
MPKILLNAFQAFKLQTKFQRQKICGFILFNSEKSSAFTRVLIDTYETRNLKWQTSKLLLTKINTQNDYEALSQVIF